MKNFCKEFNIKSLNTVDYILETDDCNNIFLEKILLFRINLLQHVLECEKCELEDNQPECNVKENLKCYCIWCARKNRAINLIEIQKLDND